MAVDTARVERRIRAGHEQTLARVDACAEVVVTTWEGRSTTDPGPLRQALETALRNRGVMSDFPEIILTATEALGYELSADPVAAPPYVTVSSLGPVLRGTMSEGRIVITIGVFEVTSQDPDQYVRTQLKHPLSVEWRESPSTKSEDAEL